MYKQVNINPYGKASGDCVVRGCAMLLGQDWERTYIELCILGLMQGDMPSSNSVLDSFLIGKNFQRASVSDECPNCITFGEFAERFFEGRYLVCTGSHVACIRDGCLLDAWDSSNELVTYFYYELV